MMSTACQIDEFSHLRVSPSRLGMIDKQESISQLVICNESMMIINPGKARLISLISYVKFAYIIHLNTHIMCTYMYILYSMIQHIYY